MMRPLGEYILEEIYAKMIHVLFLGGLMSAASFGRAQMRTPKLDVVHENNVQLYVDYSCGLLFCILLRQEAHIRGSAVWVQQFHADGAS